jgi:hypothetical protein
MILCTMGLWLFKENDLFDSGCEGLGITSLIYSGVCITCPKDRGSRYPCTELHGGTPLTVSALGT